MTQSKEEYRGHYARLAKEFADLPRVVVQVPGQGDEPGDRLLLGQLQILDLRQDDGYGAGVMVDSQLDGTNYKFFMAAAERVRLLSEFQSQLMQFVRSGPVWDGDLIGKGHRDILVKLGLVQQFKGYNFITAGGVREVLQAEWLRP